MDNESTNKKIEILLKDKNELRNEIMIFTKSLQRTIFVFISLFLFIVGIYFDVRIIPDENSRNYIILIISQLEVFLLVFGITQFCQQNIHSGYIRIIEEQINKLVNEKILMWESDITPNFISSPKGAFFWGCVIISIFLILFFFYLINISYKVINSFWFGFLLTIEVISIILLVVFSVFWEDKRVYKFIKKIIKENQPN